MRGEVESEATSTEAVLRWVLRERAVVSERVILIESHELKASRNERCTKFSEETFKSCDFCTILCRMHESQAVSSKDYRHVVWRSRMRKIFFFCFALRFAQP
eukprot:SAG11_NODE_12957_length_677_cov_0.801038_1_plen_101_part_01